MAVIVTSVANQRVSIMNQINMFERTLDRVALQIKFPRSISTLRELQQLVSGLDLIDYYSERFPYPRQDFSEVYDVPRTIRGSGNVKIIKFNVNSDPIATVLVDLGYLASIIYFTAGGTNEFGQFVSNYPKIKSNFPILAEDIRSILQGVSDHVAQILAVRLSQIIELHFGADEQTIASIRSLLRYQLNLHDGDALQLSLPDIDPAMIP